VLLAVDIGNTNINLGVFHGKRLLKRYAIPTKRSEYHSFLKKIYSQHRINDALICSVVPTSTMALAKCLKKLSGKRPYIIGKDIKVAIKNLYRKPGQVGQDRLVNSYAASRLFGAPLIVVDFGTAVTFDVVSRKQEYLGGMILPGLRISLDALFERTALLPKVNLQTPREFIGKNTRNSILSGIVYGFAAMSDDLVRRIKGKIGSNAQVILTGGDAELLNKYCLRASKIDKDLTLKGLNLLYNNRT